MQPEDSDKGPGPAKRVRKPVAAAKGVVHGGGQAPATPPRPAVRRRAAVGSVVDAVQRDLADIAKADPKLGASGLAGSALALARMIDDDTNSATSRASCAHELREALDRLRELAPKQADKDGLDDLGARRAKRIAGRPAP